MINVLTKETIDKIAAGEVVERPRSVVKELIENSIDSGADSVSVEIKEGGVALIRVTDNGSGIEKDDIPLAFVRHATSKLKTSEDLFHIASLGFRGEALASIAGVSQTELITKKKDELYGYNYRIDGGEEKYFAEIGAPDGTTIIVRNLFYNVPARKKFLKTSVTESSHITDIVEKTALSHPEISMRLVSDGRSLLHTSGNGSLKDVIYTIFGKEVSESLIEVDYNEAGIALSGFIGKPVISRSKRDFEVYFVNGRFVQSDIVTKAIEEAYKPFMMQHKFPFVMLNLSVEPESVDVNVHPQKMEVRFSESIRVHNVVYEVIKEALRKNELITETAPGRERAEKPGKGVGVLPVYKEIKAEPFEEKKALILDDIYRNDFADAKSEASLGKLSDAHRGGESYMSSPVPGKYEQQSIFEKINERAERTFPPASSPDTEEPPETLNEALTQSFFKSKDREEKSEENGKREERDKFSVCDGLNFGKDCQGLLNSVNDNNDRLDLKDNRPSSAELPGERKTAKFISKEAFSEYKIVGQVFDTYWIVEYGDKMYIIDQHAAHEKVLYERTMRTLKDRRPDSQMILPPIILNLTMAESELLKKNIAVFEELGFELEPESGNDFLVRAVPANLFSIAEKPLLMELIDSLCEDMPEGSPDIIRDRVASMSCKAAVKGNDRLSFDEAKALFSELPELENPYACPHGRPTIISMYKYELEKKFKRIV